MLWGHRNDPVNFHRCLQDFDRRLEDILEALRPGDLLIITSDHGCDPTTPSTDHSREHALLLAYAVGKNAAGHVHEGEFADVGRHRQRLAGRQGSRSRRPRPTGHRAMKLDNPLVVQWEYASEERLAKRNQTYRELTEGVIAEDAAFEAVREAKPERFLDAGCGMGELAERVQRELGAVVTAIDVSPGWSS